MSDTPAIPENPGPDHTYVYDGAMTDTAPSPRDYLVARVNCTAYGQIGRDAAAADLARYDAGEPLVRYHRSSPERGWSVLCPHPACMEWRTGYHREQQARVEWFAHAARHADDFTPSWPDTSTARIPSSRLHESDQYDLLTELGVAL